MRTYFFQKLSIFGFMEREETSVEVSEAIVFGQLVNANEQRSYNLRLQAYFGISVTILK